VLESLRDALTIPATGYEKVGWGPLQIRFKAYLKSTLTITKFVSVYELLHLQNNEELHNV